MSIFYVIFVGLAVYFSFRYDGMEEPDSHKQHRLWLMCIYLVCLSGFSYGLGGDKFTYMEEFEAYPESFSEAADFIWLKFMMNGQMPFWTIINVIAKVVFNSFYVVQLLESAAINISVCYIVSKYTHRYFLFLLIYFFSLQYFVFNTEVMREGFALAFILIGFHGYMSGRKWLYFLMLPLGIMFHVSALTALIFPFCHFKISWKSLSIAFLTAFSIWLLSDLVLSKVMMSVLGGIGAMVEKILFYSIQASTIFGFLRSVITFLILPFVVMYTVTMTVTSEDLKRRLEKLMSFMIVLAVLASSFAGFVRLFNYVQIFYLIMLADFVYMLFRSKEHLAMRVGTLATFVFLISLNYRIYYKSTDTYYYQFFFPYTCILNEDDDVFIREMAHSEAVNPEITDNNVRDID
jgi:hypothetical protein